MPTRHPDVTEATKKKKYFFLRVSGSISLQGEWSGMNKKAEKGLALGLANLDKWASFFQSSSLLTNS